MLRVLLDAVAPPRCAGCGTLAAALCDACRGTIERTAPCMRPGLSGIECVVALGPYDGALRRCILALKYANRRDVASGIAELLAASCAPPGDVLVPVPLHPERLAKRGYNQAVVLAQALARHWRSARPGAAPIEVVDALARVAATSPQSELSLEAREENVRSAFAAGPRARAIANRRVVLVDDVVTTGATLRGCARVLRACGAMSVTAVCAAFKR